MEYTTNMQLKKYLNKFPQKHKEELIKKDSLRLIYNEIMGENDLSSLCGIENRARFLRNEKAIGELAMLLKTNGFTPLFFKGIELAKKLYGTPWVRMVGDIDFYVPGNSVNEYTNILNKNGFRLKYRNGKDNKHHWVFLKDNVVYEAHLNLFNPVIEIDESCFCQDKFLRQSEYYIFDETLTFVHMLLHLYMDCCLWLDFTPTTREETIEKVSRFTYRSYELVLFAEKKNLNIDWEYVHQSVKNQKFIAIYQLMLDAIEMLFPYFKNFRLKMS